MSRNEQIFALRHLHTTPDLPYPGKHGELLLVCGHRHDGQELHILSPLLPIAGAASKKGNYTSYFGRYKNLKSNLDTTHQGLCKRSHSC